jgi:tetratricopeptide (TPR) repeat protein
MNDVASAVLDRLRPEVIGFATERFCLGDALRHLGIVTQSVVPEAMILYSARILEALSADAVDRLRQSPSTNTFSNLQTLEQLGRVGTAALYWAHALRRQGNYVRHIEGRVDPTQARLAVLFTERWLEWFFCQFSHGCRLPGLTRDGQPLGLGSGKTIQLMCRLEQLGNQAQSAALEAEAVELAAETGFAETPLLPAVLAEILLSHRQAAPARRVLEGALAAFPTDLRLRQLMGLCLSRQQQLAQALAWLEPLRREFRDDGETAGITAGVYKRIWQADRSQRDALKQSHREYRRAWEVSGEKTVYLGINAAATALWLDLRDEARKLAAEVERILRRRAATLPGDLHAATLDFQFWDRLTLAEALLVQGQWQPAYEMYTGTFACHANRAGDIEVARLQRDEIVAKLELPRPVD